MKDYGGRQLQKALECNPAQCEAVLANLWALTCVDLWIILPNSWFIYLWYWIWSITKPVSKRSIQSSSKESEEMDDAKMMMLLDIDKDSLICHLLQPLNNSFEMDQSFFKSTNEKKLSSMMPTAGWWKKMKSAYYMATLQIFTPCWIMVTTKSTCSCQDLMVHLIWQSSPATVMFATNGAPYNGARLVLSQVCQILANHAEKKSWMTCPMQVGILCYSCHHKLKRWCMDYWLENGIWQWIKWIKVHNYPQLVAMMNCHLSDGMNTSVLSGTRQDQKDSTKKCSN